MNAKCELTKLSEHGKTLVWTIEIVDESYIITKSFHEGSDKIKVSDPLYVEQKNVGKKNETSILEQCLKEMHSKIQSKMNKDGYQIVKTVNYVHSVENDIEEQNVLVYNLRKIFKTMSFNLFQFDVNIVTKWLKNTSAYQQPKLDGIRCVAIFIDDEWKFYSKKYNEIKFFDNIKNVIKDNLDKKLIYDGELIHEDGFQITTKVANVNRKEEPSEEEQEKISYNIFDIIDYYLLQDERFEMLESLKFESKYVKFVKNVEVFTWDDIEKCYNEHIKIGYEGSILRRRNSKYVGKRTNECLKIKTFDTLEVIVVDFKDGKGSDVGKVTWVCQYKGKLFLCVPKVSDEERERYFKNGQQYIGKKLTIKCQGFTDENIPRQPIGLSFRNYE
uniref:Polydeoxyribonucleotide synthase [ATP] n=1 Tax=viral metagenome TaxID=1070528 RepID=A0A6C0JSE4_9ZZZZ